MMIVERKREQELFPGFQWAEPPENQNNLKVKQVGPELHITGSVPTYKDENHPADLLGRYEMAARFRGSKRPRSNEESPEIQFANANTDDQLIEFVTRFGPVVASTCSRIAMAKVEGVFEPLFPMRLSAVQDMQELRHEQVIYRSALALVNHLTDPAFDYYLAQSLIGEIAAGIDDWPRQWDRENSQRKLPPIWKITSESIKRIQGLKSVKRDPLLPPTFDGRIVICELLNSFPGRAFPNPLEMHSSIEYGVRPLLYSLLRRQFLGPRDFSFCGNTQCRNFFSIERAGQRFCSPECSIHQRQRVYWSETGKKRREKRRKIKSKARNRG